MVPVSDSVDPKGRLGRWMPVARSGARAFIPPTLPPQPAVDLGPLQNRLDRANQALGRWDGVSSVLPDRRAFLYMYIRKEAVLSSQIEGTQSSLSDLLRHESHTAPGVPLDDVEEVSTYVAALEHGLDRIRSGFPLSLRLIRECHEILLSTGRGATKAPGQFRQSQNWIGGATLDTALFVPPPANSVPDLLSDLEKFVHAGHPEIPQLVRAGLIHVQFETIHPFLDGNGRIGRLLITLYLCALGVLKEPTLYLSLFFKTQRSMYYDLLQKVRMRGDWESWLSFFLEGVESTSNQATEAAQKIVALFAKDRQKIEQLGRVASSVLRLHELLQQRPLITVAVANRALDLSPPTIRVSAQHLVALGILSEVPGRGRSRLYVYDSYLGILSEGTEPL